MRLGVAAESRGDADTVTTLADRVIVRDVDWITEDVLHDYRTWRGLGDAEWVDVHHVSRLAHDAGLKLYGHFDGKPGAPDAQMHRKLLSLFALEPQPLRPALVVVARDVDGDERRREGFRQAVAERDWPFAIVGALAQPEIEAWLLAAWTPDDESEEALLAMWRALIGFDPTQAPQRLTSTARNSERDAKYMLDALCAQGRDPDTRWRVAPLDDRLREAGRACGLTDCLDDLNAKLVPLFR